MYNYFIFFIRKDFSTQKVYGAITPRVWLLDWQKTFVFILIKIRLN